MLNPICTDVAPDASGPRTDGGAKTVLHRSRRWQSVAQSLLSCCLSRGTLRIRGVPGLLPGRPAARWRGLLFGALLAAVLLSGCGLVSDPEQLDSGLAGQAIEPGHTFGQTFVARHGGLTEIQFWVGDSNHTKGTLRLDLLREPGADHVLASTELSMADRSGPGFVSFVFDPQRDSHGTYYFARVTYRGSGMLSVGRGPAEAYRDGALYLDTVPQRTQAAFQLAYHPLWVTVDLAIAALRGVGLVCIGFLLYVVPGYGLLAVVWPRSQLSCWEKMPLAVGVSLSLYPLLLAWTSAVGLHLGALNVWLPIAFALSALAWRSRIWDLRQRRQAIQSLREGRTWEDVALLAVLALVFGVRLLVARSLDAPMWGDSYQHSVITQLILDNGGLFESWEPYAPFTGLSVHTGFHAIVAAYGWLTGCSGADATLWGGQLLGGLAVVTLVPLALKIGRGRVAGIATVVVAGLLSPMPGYYVNWGRYAQLAGQAILPVTLWLLWIAVEKPQARRPVALLGGVCLAGMTLSYYRMPFYFLAFVVPWFLLWSWSYRRSAGGWRGYGRMVLVCVFLGLAGLVCFAPWFSHLIGSDLATNMGKSLSAAPSAAKVLADYSVWRNVLWYIPSPLAVLAVLAAVWALIRTRWEAVVVALWILLLGALVAGQLIGLPGSAYMQNFSVVIMLYLPVSLLIAWFVAQLASASGGRLPLRGGLSMSLVLFASLAGLRTQVGIVDPRYMLVTRPDVHAMAWIRDNVRADAHFLVEAFRIYGGRSVVGADAGWWLPLYTSRSSTVPPQYALLNEVPHQPDYEAQLVSLVAVLEETSPASATGLRALCDAGVTHAYVGQRAGRIGEGAQPLFHPDDLVASEFFSVAYHRDHVYIFSLGGQVCAGLGP